MNEENCEHEETEEGYCCECGEFVFTYEMEHDSGDMER